LRNRKTKKPNFLFGFFYNYWITIVLLVILATLIRQNFIINKFPFILNDKQDVIDNQIVKNLQISADNADLEKELAKMNQTNMEIIESTARYKFGLIKDGELFYRVSRAQESPSIED